LLVDVAFAAGLPERVRAGVDGAVEHAVHLVVGRDRPFVLAVREAAHRESDALPAHPQPHLPDRPQLGEPVEDRLDRAADRLVGIEQDLTLLLAPDQTDRECVAQLAALGLVADSALQATAEHVQLRLAHGAFKPRTIRSLNEPGW
jgi:hypothetical protein